MKSINSIIGLTALKYSFIGSPESKVRERKNAKRAPIPAKLSSLKIRIPSSITADFCVGESFEEGKLRARGPLKNLYGSCIFPRVCPCKVSFRNFSGASRFNSSYSVLAVHYSLILKTIISSKILQERLSTVNTAGFTGIPFALSSSSWKL